MKKISEHNIVVEVVLLLLFSCYASTVFATINSFNHLTIRDGLSQSTVTSLFQDKNGFLWIGTQDGLNCYDGYSFTVYSAQRNTFSLSSSSITAVAEDKQGKLWVGTQSGVCVLDRGTGKFIRIPLHYGAEKGGGDVVNALFLDEDSCMWVGTNRGLTCYCHTEILSGKDSIQQVCFTNGNNYIPLNGVIQIGGRGNSIWVVANNGLFYMDKAEQQIKAESSLPAGFGALNCMFIDGNMLYAGFEEGVLRFDRNSPNNGWESLDYQDTHIKGVSFMKMDSNENLWIGTRFSGIYVYNTKAKLLFNHRHIEIEEASLNSNMVNSIAVTRSGLVIVGTDFGLNFYNERQGLFNQIVVPSLDNQFVRNVHGMVQDNYQNIWIGTKGSGAYVISPKGDVLYHFEDERIGDRVQCICQDRDGYFWLGSINKGICRIKITGDNYSSYELSQYSFSDGEDNAANLSNTIYDIFEDVNGNLWFGTANGLCLLPYAEKKKAPDKYKFIKSVELAGAKEGEMTTIYDIYRDRLGVLWLGTMRNGLARLSDIRSELFDTEMQMEASLSLDAEWFHNDLNDLSSLAGNNIHCIYEDRLNGNLWAGTDAGLCKYNREQNNFRNLTTENGLLSNVVYGILEDKEGCLWLSTNDGLSKYNQKEDVFYNFGVSNGLQYPEFNGKAYLKTDDGLLIFGGPMGINSFYPEKIRPGNYVAPVYITGFKIRNSKITVNDEKSIFSKPIFQTSKITLKHNQNFFTISFSLLNFENQELNRFAYKLEGFQDDWIYLTGDHLATYTGIPPGDYKFIVKGSDGYSLWDTKGQELDIEILPPFWNTFWAKVVYILFVASMVFFVWKDYQRRMSLKLNFEKHRLLSQKNRELYEERLEFYANISHEFLTPLTLISGPVQDLIMELKDNPLRNKAILMNRNVARLKRLINEILSLRKLDSGKMKINVEKIDIDDFIREIAAGFNGLAVRRNIRFTVNAELTGNEAIWIDPDVVEKILYNLLSNAFKYTKDGGEISVQIKLEKGTYLEEMFQKAKVQSVVYEEYVSIKVKDSGSGISNKEKARIFERYYQSDNQNNGFGIGLAFSQKMASVHQGFVGVRSKQNKGSSFVLYLPVGDVYSDSQKGVRGNSIKQNDYRELGMLPALPVQRSSASKNTILLVEDNYEMRHYVADALSYEFNIVLAENGQVGLDQLANNKIDIIISDIIMPIMDGEKFLHEVKKSGFEEIPLIFLSAINDSEKKKKCIDAGAKAFVTKPFETPYLITVIKRILQQSGTIKRLPDENILDVKITTEIESANDRLLNQLRKSIEKNYSNPDFNVNSLAEDIGLSRSQLHRRFKAITGETPSNLLKEIRMQEAVHLLETSSAPIADICYAVGFSDPKYFSREFRKKYGMSPSSFIRSSFREK